MNPALQLLRPDLREFAGYASARRSTAKGNIWLNANESPLPSPADASQSLNRYPDPQPTDLRERLAELYGVGVGQLAITRGSDEGIDLLVRAFCRARVDAVLTSPPCFGMYAVSARIQQAALVEVPLLESETSWLLDIPGIVAAGDSCGVRVVFLCSPANPTGQAFAQRCGLRIRIAVERLARVCRRGQRRFVGVEPDISLRRAASRRRMAGEFAKVGP